MKTKFYAAMILLTVVNILDAGQTETIVNLESKNGTLEGSLLLPESKTGIPVALIIAGSGPTDRDGNNPAMKNNSLKLLANALSVNGIASLRYDKRGIGKSQKAGGKEEDLRFDHYISDAKGWLSLLRTDERFKEVIVISDGHAEDGGSDRESQTFRRPIRHSGFQNGAHGLLPRLRPLPDDGRRACRTHQTAGRYRC